MIDEPIRHSLGERCDQSVYILWFEQSLIKVGRGVRPTLRSWHVARDWGMECKVAWTTKPHPRAAHIERTAHRMLQQFRVDMRELFTCSIATATTVIKTATVVQDEWLRQNPAWLAEHTAQRRLAAEAWNDWRRATKKQRWDAARASYP